MLKLLIKNGTVITANETYKADIGVTDEHISHIVEPGGLDNLAAEKVIDAEGKYSMPGFIEPHMHVKAPFSGTIDILDLQRQ